ncbi:Ribokinase-like protein [Dothidotthia symphoricarpi CBS 119687]|uniref:Ribokinase-like protein n=1 Tax=Dothidotthia symphoricarpi CBS 119687 TaxID=1392245 RepID=A0A6A6AJU2_9PLEO|nr:Ribokinase-like protein [Dothidotthia symphoricarpi CBS 119687]KAF2131826.1 Ribokinase-like protein [Dothidotthia symphoricarpi CBS 119687]
MSAPILENAHKHIICIGAIYVDTILNVPHFPIEDQKLRAKKLTRRRGGNTGNTLEVLAQLLEHDPGLETDQDPQAIQLHLLAVLPDRQSITMALIRDSLPRVDLDHSCIFREGHMEAASSYIIQNEQNLSRTIVSINELPEMTANEFTAQASRMAIADNHGWFHFEGRIPDVTLECVQYLRSKKEFASFKISVECEKPERTGMADVARLADVVFYSRLWADSNGYDNATTFLESQISSARPGALLCCTWGAGGATAVQKSTTSHGVLEWESVHAWQPETKQSLVDTVGAGDTFVAGMLFTLSSREDWKLQEKLQFANQLAGRKVLQDGFAGLGRKIFRV